MEILTLIALYFCREDLAKYLTKIIADAIKESKK